MTTQEQLEQIKVFWKDNNLLSVGQTPLEAQKKLLALIDSATREAYKQGYIDAGIKAITEQSGASDE